MWRPHFFISYVRDIPDQVKLRLVVVCVRERIKSYTSLPLIHPTHKLDPYEFVADSSQMNSSSIIRSF